jgi:hypothetical protein
MEQEDPEKRIFELERQLAEQRGADLPAASADHAAASRQFVATSSAFSAFSFQWTGMRSMIFVYGGLAAIFAAIFAVRAMRWSGGPIAIMVLLLFVIPVGVGGFFWLQSRKKILIDVTSNGLTVNKWPGDAFSFADAKLGPWAMMGVALHLQSGSRRLLLGGRDRRIAPTTRLDAPPVPAVDAWLVASEFDELLAIGGRRSGLAQHGPALGEPTRCLLFPRSAQRLVSSSEARKNRRTGRSHWQPSLAVDVDNDAIRVIDLDSNALSASASLAQVTATPVTYSYVTGGGSDGSYRVTLPGLVMGVPGLQPLAIGYNDQHRFSWRRNVPVEKRDAAYAVSEADWLTLVEKFGLAPYRKDA